MGEIRDLIPDIYKRLNTPAPLNEDLLNEFLSRIKDAVVETLSAPQEGDRPILRLSKTGTPLRKLWYENHFKKAAGEVGEIDEGELENESPMKLKFLTGHIIEALLLLIIKETGKHTVEHEQSTVSLLDVEGHLDCVIDGHLMDIKTASHWGFRKFLDSSVVRGNDPFGYTAQLSAYRKALLDSAVPLKDTSFFFAYNKSDSDLVLTPVQKEDIIDAEELLRKQKECLKAETVEEFPICYPDIPFGKSGNMEIAKECGWCPFKEICRGGEVRKFKYSDREVWLTEVASEPKVEEVK